MLEFFILSLFWYAAPAINLRYTSNTSTLEIEEEEDDWSKERKKQKRINIGAGGYWRDVIRTIMVGNAHDQDSTHDQQLRLTTVTQRYRRIQRLHESFKIGRYENLSLLEGQLKVYKLQRNCNCNNAPKFPELQVSLIREFGTHKLLPDSDSPPPRRPIPLTFMKLDPHTTHNSQSSLPTPLRSTEAQKHKNPSPCSCRNCLSSNCSIINCKLLTSENIMQWTKILNSIRRIRLLFLWGHLHLGGMWLGVAPRTDTKMTCVHGGHHVQNMITILGSAVDIIEDNMYEHSMSSMRSVTSVMNMVFIWALKDYEESSYGLINL